MSEPAAQLELGLPPRLPPYQLRRSRRARYLSVTVTPQQGVVVTLPARMAARAVEPFLLQHGDWLQRELARPARHPTARERGRLPRRIVLPALEREFAVRYTAAANGTRVRERDRELEVQGDTGDRNAVPAALRRWLARTAKRALTARLHELSVAADLPYARCSIRGQRARWGSGSTSGHICLNYKLLFLRPDLVDYVLLHELTHTVHADHSPRFWRRLIRLQPAARRLHRDLGEAGAEVPWWAER